MNGDDINSLEPSVCGYIPMERLEQFVEEDTWHFSEEESDDEDSLEDLTETEWPQDPEVSLLPKEGYWIDLCKSSNTVAAIVPTQNTDNDSSLDQSMGLQSVIDYFLSKLEPYNSTYIDEEEETTDNGGNRASDTKLLLEEDGDSQTQSPMGTLERGVTSSVQERGVTGSSVQERGVTGSSVQERGVTGSSVQEQGHIRTDSSEEKDHAKPIPAAVELSKRPKYFFIANEILTSERTYVQGIRMLEKVLHGAVKTARNGGKPMIPETIRKRIFLNISEIFTLNTDFLSELENRIESWDTNPTISDTLASRAPYFKLYSMYAARYEDSQMAYGEALKKSKPFYELVQHIENSNLCKGLPVTSYMLYPIQRIPRYKLLLKDYLKHLPVSHADRSYTEEALKTISEVAQHLNDRIKDLEEQSTVVKLQKLFSGKETLVVPGRKFVLRGPVEQVSGKKLNRRKTRVLFLFSDVLLLTKIARNIKFKILSKFSLTDIQVSSMSSHSYENDFCVFLPTVTKPFRFCTRDRKERDVWVKYLRRSSLLEIEKRRSFETIKKIQLSKLNNINKRSVQSIFQDPSFESRQPKLTRRTIHPRRQMIINASKDRAGIEETDGGVEETDGGTEETDGGIEETDGGTEETDGGTEETDGGIEETDGGTEETDGGTEETDGGIEETDGGTEETDGGTEETDGGTEETDGGTEETDGGLMDDIMLRMELMDDNEETDDSSVLQPGLDNSLSSYINYKKEGPSNRDDFVKMWFVLTYTGLTGYCNHKTDEACWALVLAGCRMTSMDQYSIKVVTPEGVIHVLQLTNEYDYIRWTKVLQELLNSDVNRI